MLRIIPYLLLWLGLWSWYFPCANLNPFSHAPDAGLISLSSPINGLLSLSGNLFLFNQPTWKVWFALTGALTLSLAIFLLVKDNRLQQEHERRLLQKLRKAERAALRSKMNPHFIFNVLNSIQGFIIDGDKVSSARYLSKFSKLVRTALDHSERQAISLEEELTFLQKYLELEQLRFNGKFDFVIKVAPDIDSSSEYISPMLLQPYIENAILHGFAPMKGKGHLEIIIMPNEHGLTALIKDNGIGISASKKRKGYRKQQHESLGMSLAERRIGLLPEQNGRSYVEIKELVGAGGKVEGTEVEVGMGIEVLGVNTSPNA